MQEPAGSQAGGDGEEGEEGGGRAGELQLCHGPEAPRLQRQGQPAAGAVLVYSVVYTVHCTVDGVQCTVYSVQCVVYSVLCTVYIVQCIVYSVVNSVV